MIETRVIPLLLLRGRGLYKGIRFRDHRYVGDPINVIKIFNEKEVDEVCLLDISATEDRREPDLALLERVAGEAFMPMAYGGGIRTVEHVRRVFQAGYEKVVVNTAAYADPAFLERAAAVHGSQSVVVSIDVRRDFLGRQRVWTRSGRQVVRGLGVREAAQYAVEHGAGEILLTSIDREGTFSGYDLDLIGSVAAAVSVPVIASGGSRTIEDLKAAKRAGASAVGAGAMFVYQGPHRAVLISYPSATELRSVSEEPSSAARSVKG